MDEHDPYTPVATKRSPVWNSDRPYYIYATSIVLLLWAGVFVYLQLNYELSEAGGVITLSLPANFAIEVDIGAVIVAIAASIFAVNALLWCVRKLVSASGVAGAERGLCDK